MEKDHANRSKQLAFSLSKFDDWKIRMQALLCSIHDEMWDVITTRPIIVMMVNTQVAAQGAGAEQMIPKPKDQYTSEERTRANLDNVARNILYNSLDDSLFPRVRKCKNAMEIWKVLMELGKGDEQEKDNKLTVTMKKFEDFKMLPNETIMDMELRFTRLMGDLTDLGKELSEKEKNLKILRGLPKSWEIKVIAMRDNRDMKTTSTAKIFSDLKAYEFEHEPKDVEESETRNVALVASQQATNSNRSKSNSCEFLSDEQYALFVRKMKRFMRKDNFQDSHRSGHRKQHESSPQTSKGETPDSQLLCYNCRKPGHFKANFPHPIVSKHQDSNATKSPSKETGERYKRNDKPESSSSRNERRKKAMVVNETSDNVEAESSSSSSSSDDESTEEEKGLLCLFSQESEDLCLMVDEDEVNSHSSSCYSAESSSVGSQTSNESVTEMMRRIKVIKNTYSKLKEENSRLMISYNALRQVRVENIKLAIDKQVIWYVDSGCSRHMTGDKTMLSNFKEVDGPKVIFGGENSGKTRGKGDIIKQGITIQDVSYVDGLKFNLLSTSQFCDKGYKVEFSKNECKIVNTKDGKIALTGQRKKKMYVISWNSSNANVCFVAKSNADLSQEWNNKLSHLNLKIINKLAKRNLVRGCFIHNNGKNHLTTFDERADEGLFMGYSSNPAGIESSTNPPLNSQLNEEEVSDDEEDILSSYTKYQLRISEPETTTQEKLVTQQSAPDAPTPSEPMIYVELPYIPEMDAQNQQNAFEPDLR
ncbi:PREDICTED: uncharacterized protein LOC109178675 [Ipomoea nil]|uniref:uncharacterized protein LOC109178675 n=1 Tax=Ipomoea nil TaxID=35883 RepID=UPI000901E872|nr:PREDICTED: uncharacterized protein LOC109178675 [Ipomoea nil]